jgi:hypothetical protein
MKQQPQIAGHFMPDCESLQIETERTVLSMRPAGQEKRSSYFLGWAAVFCNSAS